MAFDLHGIFRLIPHHAPVLGAGNFSVDPHRFLSLFRALAKSQVPMVMETSRHTP